MGGMSKSNDREKLPCFLCLVNTYMANNSHLIEFVSISCLLNDSSNFTNKKDRNGRWSQGYMLSSPQESSTASKTATENHNHGEEMNRIRQRQQEIADEHAKEAYRKRKEKDKKEMNRKNHAAKDNSSGSNGDQLGNGGSYRTSTGTNRRHILQRSTSNTPSYRPT